MRLKEQRLWDTFKRNRPPKFWLQRIENVVGDGMPDVVSMAPFQLAWVELKAPIKPKRETTQLMGKEGLSIGQVSWHLKAALKGQRSFVLIRDSSGELFLVPSAFAPRMNAATIGELRMMSVADNWKDVYRWLS